MPFIATKYAALIFKVTESNLRYAAINNSKKYTYTKYHNKLLFKVTNSQLSIALNKGLISANIEVYNDDLTLIQDFFKTNSRRTNARAEWIQGKSQRPFKTGQNTSVKCRAGFAYGTSNIQGYTALSSAVSPDAKVFSSRDDDGYAKGELNANNKENSNDIRDNTNDGKEDARDKEARARIYESVGYNDTRPANAGENKGAKELTQSTSTFLPNNTAKLSVFELLANNIHILSNKIYEFIKHKFY